MCAWFILVSSSSEGSYNWLHASNYLELVRAKAHVAACSASFPCTRYLFCAFLAPSAYPSSLFKPEIRYIQSTPAHTAPALVGSRQCWLVLLVPCSALAWAELLPASPTDPTRSLAPSLSLTFRAAGSFDGKACPSAMLPASVNSFSLLFLLFDSFLSPDIGWLFPDSGYLSLPAVKHKDLLTFLSSVLLGQPLDSAGKTGWNPLGLPDGMKPFVSSWHALVQRREMIQASVWPGQTF